MAARTRYIVDDNSRPALSRHVRLEFNELRGQWVLLAPEKVMWPDDISVDILKRCTGRDTIAEIVAALSKVYDAPAEQIAPDVVAFLQEWSDRLLIRCGTDAAETK